MNLWICKYHNECAGITEHTNRLGQLQIQKCQYKYTFIPEHARYYTPRGNWFNVYCLLRKKGIAIRWKGETDGQSRNHRRVVEQVEG